MITWKISRRLRNGTSLISCLIGKRIRRTFLLMENTNGQLPSITEKINMQLVKD